MIHKESPIPLYQQIKELLSERINKGQIGVGCRVPSESQLSREYSVNRLTARRAILELEQDGMIHTVRGKGRYVRKSFTIGIYPLETDVAQSSFYTLGLLNGLMAGSSNYKSENRFFSQEDFSHAISGLPKFLRREKIDGLLWNSPPREDLPAIRNVVKAGIPVVIINRAFPGSGVSYVASDNYVGSRQVTEHLIKLGHRKIACISAVRTFVYAAERWRGYSDAYIGVGVTLDEKLTVEINDLSKSFATWLDRLWSGSKKPSAIFIAGGKFIAPTLEYLIKRGMRIPEDISVVGFDEVPLPSRLPKIMTVKQPLAEMAKTAMSTLIKVLKREKSEPVEIVMETEIIKRNSCTAFSERGRGKHENH